MFTVLVKATSDVTDMDYLKRRVEALHFNAVVVGKQIVVTARSYTPAENYFMLADLLHRNSPMLIDFTIDVDTAKKQREIEDGVEFSNSMNNG